MAALPSSGDLMKITTKTGFECDICEEALNDWEVVERLVAAQEGNISAMITVIKDLLGAEGYDKVKDSVRTDTGRVPVDKLTTRFYEILRAAGEANQAKKK